MGKINLKTTVDGLGASLGYIVARSLNVKGEGVNDRSIEETKLEEPNELIKE